MSIPSIQTPRFVDPVYALQEVSAIWEEVATIIRWADRVSTAPNFDVLLNQVKEIPPSEAPVSYLTDSEASQLLQDCFRPLNIREFRQLFQVVFDKLCDISFELLQDERSGELRNRITPIYFLVLELIQSLEEKKIEKHMREEEIYEKVSDRVDILWRDRFIRE